jgi:hypothetical protein
MPLTLTEATTYDASISVPAVVDAFALAPLVAAYQAFANRTNYLKLNALIAGETFAGAKTINCGANAFTITGGAGATSITRTLGTITLSGAGGMTVQSSGGNAELKATGASNAASVTTAGGAINVIAAGTGTITVDAGGDLILHADGNASIGGDGSTTISAGTNVVFAPTGTWGGAANKAALTGAGYPSRAAQSFTNVGVRWMAQQTIATNTFFYNINGPGELVHGVSTQETITIELVLSPAATYTSFTVRMRGADTAALPSTNDAFRIFEQDAETSTALSSLVVDPATPIATYKSYHDVAVALTTTLRPVAGRRYFMTWRTAGGSGAITAFFASLVKIGATGATDKFGIGNEPTA